MIDELAKDVGRLRRQVGASYYQTFLINRISDRIEALDAMLRRTAAELYRDDCPVEMALMIVDNRAAELRSYLGRGRT